MQTMNQCVIDGHGDKAGESLLTSGTLAQRQPYVQKERGMYRRLRRMLALALAVLFVVTALALADDGQKMSGMVTNVDAKKGSITLMTKDGKPRALLAPKNVLAEVQSGDSVELSVEGNKIKTLHKK